MSIAALDGIAAVSASVQIPGHGVWWADVELSEEASLSGSVTLTVLDASFVGTIVAGGPSRGRSRYRVAGGAGAWGAVIQSRSYVNDLGVKRATIVTDAADACGETVDLSGLSGTVGPAYVRASGRASASLDYVSPRAWHVGLDGVTRFGARASVTLETTAARTRIDEATGVIVLAPETLVGLVPGVVIDGARVADVRHDVTPDDGIRTTLWAARAPGSRRREALRAIVRAFVPELRWSGEYEYRVVGQFGARVDLQPVLSSLGMPDLPLVRVRHGVPGASATYTPGALVTVAFINRDPARPVIVAFDDTLALDVELDATNSIALGGSATRGVARLGDTAGPYVITSASTKVVSE